MSQEITIIDRAKDPQEVDIHMGKVLSSQVLSTTLNYASPFLGLTTMNIMTMMASPIVGGISVACVTGAGMILTAAAIKDRFYTEYRDILENSKTPEMRLVLSKLNEQNSSAISKAVDIFSIRPSKVKRLSFFKVLRIMLSKKERHISSYSQDSSVIEGTIVHDLSVSSRGFRITSTRTPSIFESWEDAYQQTIKL